MKLAIQIIILLFCNYAYAKNDTLNAAEQHHIQIAYRNSCYGQLLLTDSCSKSHDSIAAGYYMMRVDPYYLIYDGETPENIDDFLTKNYTIPIEIRSKYIDSFTKIYTSPKNVYYQTFEKMFDEDRSIRAELNKSHDSASCSVGCDKMLLTDSIHFAYLLRYVHKYGWPSVTNGSMYAAIIALHDHRHHALYRPFIQEAVMKGEIDRQVLDLIIYWQTRTDDLFAQISKRRYILFDVTSILSYEMPDCLPEIEKVVAAHCPVKLLWLEECGKNVHEREVLFELNLGLYGKVLSRVENDLLDYDCRIDSKTASYIQEGLWNIHCLYTSNDTSKMSLYLLYGNEIKYSDLDILFADSSFATHAIYFDNNKPDIKPESYVFLNELVQWLKSKTSINIEISGHTDNVGSMQANMTLSKARAEEVKKYLVAEGIEISRISTKGYGSTQPISNNTSDEGRGQNRRVEFRHQ